MNNSFNDFLNNIDEDIIHQLGGIDNLIKMVSEENVNDNENQNSRIENTTNIESIPVENGFDLSINIDNDISEQIGEPIRTSSPLFCDKINGMFDVEKKAIKRNEKNRCGHCNCKLKLTDLECRCGIKYCSKDRLPENHNCNFDYKSHSRVILEKNNNKVVTDKIKNRI